MALQPSQPFQGFMLKLTGQGQRFGSHSQLSLLAEISCCGAVSGRVCKDCLGLGTSARHKLRTFPQSRDWKSAEKPICASAVMRHSVVMRTMGCMVICSLRSEVAFSCDQDMPVPAAKDRGVLVQNLFCNGGNGGLGSRVTCFFAWMSSSREYRRFYSILHKRIPFQLGPLMKWRSDLEGHFRM
jgi:hypothetical protein